MIWGIIFDVFFTAPNSSLMLSSPDCRAAWAEKRRRFLGVESDASEPAGDAAVEKSEAPAPSSEPQPAKGL